MSKFSKEELEEARKKYSRGSLIDKINAKEKNVQFVPIDAETIDNINRRALVSIKSHTPKEDADGHPLFRH